MKLVKITTKRRYGEENSYLIDPSKVTFCAKEHYGDKMILCLEGLNAPIKIDGIDEKDYNSISEQIQEFAKKHDYLYDPNKKWTK